MKIAIVAGELSGDILGAGLIHALRRHVPSSEFEGIGGDNMIAAGLHSHYPLDTLSVMGLIEVIKHYRSIKRCYNALLDHLLANPPDVFIGIDAPDFNLRLEEPLKQAGIPTVHYVSPSVWAWRQGRIHKIKRACDLMLTLLPFEAAFYQAHHMPVKFVGHPLADDIELTPPNPVDMRLQLGLTPNTCHIALLPGSRENEVRKLGSVFLRTACWLHARNPNLHFIVPIAHPRLRILFTQQVAEIAPQLPLTILSGQSIKAMSAADVVLTTSGTATLEALLLKRPMVVAYRMAELTYWLAHLLVSVKYFALPNLLAEERLVPEFLQHQVTPAHLGQAVLDWLQQPAAIRQVQQRFTQIHQQLRRSASEQAALGVISVTQ